MYKRLASGIIYKVINQFNMSPKVFLLEITAAKLLMYIFLE